MAKGKRPKYAITKKGSPYWWYKFKIEGRTFIGSTGCEEAKAAAQVIEDKRVEARQIIDAERQDLGYIKNGRKQVTLEQALNRFEADKGHEWKTLRNKKLYADYLLNLGDGGTMLLSEITEEMVIRYRQSRKKLLTPRKTVVKDSTLNREVSHLQACMNYCGKVLKYDISLMDWKQCKNHAAERIQQWVLSPSQEGKLFKEIAKERRDLVPLVQFAVWSCVRKAALVNMKWDHVNLEEGVAIVFLKSKGEQIEHAIALTDRMIELLKALPRIDGCDYVFTYECVQNTRDRKGVMRLKGQRYRFSEAGWTKVWLRALKAAGLKGFRFHDLRHTGATRLTRTTGDIQLTQGQLGHQDMKTTIRYSKVDVNDLRAAQEKAQRQVVPAAANDELEAVEEVTA